MRVVESGTLLTLWSPEALHQGKQKCSTVAGTSQADAGVLLQHLVFGGIPTALCFSFEDSESAVSQQKLLSELDPPEEVLHVSCQACNMALALR